MAFEPFTKDEQPTMANFNEKLQAILGELNISEQQLKTLISSAQSAADAAQSMVNGRLQIQTGSYSGAGGSSKTISLSFAPKVVLIVGNNILDSTSTVSFRYDKIIAIAPTHTETPYPDITRTYTFSTDSFTVAVSPTSPENAMSRSGTKYYYAAFG